MDPKEFSWEESQQVTVTNPTKDTYKFKVHSKDYEMKAGETAKMPGFIAWVYVYGLAQQMATNSNVGKDKNGNRVDDFNHWNEEGFRKQYYDKIIVGADDIIERIVPVPAIEKVDVTDDESTKVKLGRPFKQPQSVV